MTSIKLDAKQVKLIKSSLEKRKSALLDYPDQVQVLKNKIIQINSSWDFEFYVGASEGEICMGIVCEESGVNPPTVCLPYEGLCW